MDVPGQSSGSPLTQLRAFWHWMQTAILKDEEDSAVNSFTLTQDVHTHRAGPVGKKLQLSLVHREMDGDPLLWTVSLQEKLCVEFFVVVLAFFFNGFYKTVHAFREDSWVKSTSHSPGCFVGLLFLLSLENLTRSLTPTFQHKTEKHVFHL